MAGHCLVDRIIDDLVDQVMQPAKRGVAEVRSAARGRSKSLSALLLAAVCSTLRYFETSSRTLLF